MAAEPPRDRRRARPPRDARGDGRPQGGDLARATARARPRRTSSLALLRPSPSSRVIVLRRAARRRPTARRPDRRRRGRRSTRRARATRTLARPRAARRLARQPRRARSSGDGVAAWYDRLRHRRATSSSASRRASTPTRPGSPRDARAAPIADGTVDDRRRRVDRLRQPPTRRDAGQRLGYALGTAGRRRHRPALRHGTTTRARDWPPHRSPTRSATPRGGAE